MIECPPRPVLFLTLIASESTPQIRFGGVPSNPSIAIFFFANSKQPQLQSESSLELETIVL